MTTKEESVEIIEELLDCISWLGGDPYEVEAADQMCENARNFLEKHKPKEPEVVNRIKIEHNYNLYCLKSDESKQVYAQNKRHARNSLRVPLSEIKFLKLYRELII